VQPYGNYGYAPGNVLLLLNAISTLVNSVALNKARPRVKRLKLLYTIRMVLIGTTLSKGYGSWCCRPRIGWKPYVSNVIKRRNMKSVKHICDTCIKFKKDNCELLSSDALVAIEGDVVVWCVGREEERENVEYWSSND